MIAGNLTRYVGHVALTAMAFCLAIQPIAAQGAGDLLVAPTRLELNGFRGTEVVLNNIGSEKATYRISLEFRRMMPDGKLLEVDPAEANDHEKLAEQIIAYAPRRVTLEPNQPQSIRVGVRPPADLPDGEYRVHMLFRAIPEPTPATSAAPMTDGLAIELRPIYGVTIPVIVRVGQLSAEAQIGEARLVTKEGRQFVSIGVARTGERSLYGDILIRKPGVDEPVAAARGVAIYTEIDHRAVDVDVPPELVSSLPGPAVIQYVERTPEGLGRTLAETQVNLR